MVEVEFRPDLLSYAELLDFAVETSCDQRVYATSEAQLRTARGRVGSKAELLDGRPRDAKPSDQLYYLSRSPLRYLPLTPGQARKVNAALGRRGTEPPSAFLSPRQSQLLERIQAALEKDEKALESLKRPDDLGALREYAAELESRLSSAS